MPGEGISGARKAGIVVNPKTEVLRLSSTKFRRLPIWASSYDLTIDICRLAEGRECEEMRELARTAIQIPKAISKSASFSMGRNHIRHMRNTFMLTRQLGVMLLLCYQLDKISSEKYIELNSKTNILSKKMFRYIRSCQRKM